MQHGQIQNKKAVREFFLNLKDGRWIIEADNSKKRTLPQNKFIHAVLFPEFRKALNEVGYGNVKTDQQAKDIAKKMFLTRQVPNENTGEVLEYIQDTHDLTTVELNVFIDEVIRFAAEEMNYIIPFPNEQLQMNYDSYVHATIIN